MCSLTPLKIEDFVNYRFLSGLEANPSQTALAFVCAQADLEKNSYNRNLMIYDGKVRQLTAGNEESFFFFDSDDEILFAGCRDERDKKRAAEGEEFTVFYKISIHGGEAVKAFEVPYVVSSVKKINDDLYAMLISWNRETSVMAEADEANKARILEKKKEDTAVEVITQLPFYLNGQGFLNGTRTRLMFFTPSTGRWEFLTDELTNVYDLVLSQDHEKLLMVAGRYETVSEDKDGIFEVNVASKKISVALEQGQYAIFGAWYLGGKIVVAAARGDRFGINENPQFYVLKDQQLQLLAPWEQNFYSSVGSDCRLGGGSSTRVYKDRLYFVYTERNAAHLAVLDTNGNISTVIDTEGSIDGLDFYKDKPAVIGMYGTKLQELYIDGQQVSAINEAALDGKYVSNYHKFQYENDGVVLDGWVLYPMGYDPEDQTKKYPAILDIHGGPKTVYGEVFFHEMQVWAGAGYFVCYTNPRGSDGRGNEFADIRGKYGTVDYSDLMTFMDQVLKRYPEIDEKRVGETGGSYGGFMSNWMIGHTDRFAAVASQRSIANWIGFEGASDIGPRFANDQCGANLETNLEKMWYHSPLKYAKNAVTPTLFIHSDQDYRCPVFEAYQMATALMNKGVPTRLVLFHGENHELSRSGKPKNRIRRLREITEWMDKYCKK